MAAKATKPSERVRGTAFGKPGKAVLLIDAPESGGRTTATLLASLVARLTSMHLVTGATAIGSLVSGFAVLGKQVSRTAPGARLRRALAAGKPGTNAALLWKELRIHEWAALSAPAPVLDHMRNDAALLLAQDLEGTLELLPIPPQRDEPVEGASAEITDAREHALDCMLGLWAYSKDLVAVIEALAATSSDDSSDILAGSPSTPPPSGQVLR